MGQRDTPEPLPARFGRKGWVRATFFATALLAGMTSFLDGTNARYGWLQATVRVPVQAGVQEPSGVWRLRPERPVRWRAVWAPAVRLVTAAPRPLLFVPNPAWVSQLPGTTFSLDRAGNLLLDPAWAGQPGWWASGPTVRLPAVLPGRWRIVLACVALGAGLAGLVLGVSSLADAARRLTDAAKAGLAVAGRHPAPLLLLPSLYFLASYSPLWKDVDASCQLLYATSATTVYHFPALFCILGRLPAWLATGLTQPFRPFDEQHPTLAGLGLLVLLQHAALVLGLRSFVGIATDRPVWRGACALLLASTSALYAQAQLCGSESWSLIATVFLVAGGLRAVQSPRALSGWAMAAVALTLAIGTRHVNVLFGGWLLALTFPAVALALAKGWRVALCWRSLGPLALALSAFAIAVLANRLVTSAVGRSHGLEARSTLGRTLSNRIAAFLEHLEPEQRVKLAERLAASTDDPKLKAAVRIQVAVGSFYAGGDRPLGEFLSAQGLTGEHAEAERDRVELKAMVLYLKTWHPKLLEVIAKDIRTGFLRGTNRNLALSAFQANLFGAGLVERDPASWRSLAALRSARFPEAAVWWEISRLDPYVGSGRRVAIGWLVVVEVALWGWAWRRGVSVDRLLPWVSLVGTGCAIFVVTCVCIYLLHRYTLPLFVTVWLALIPSAELAFGSMKRAGR